MNAPAARSLLILDDDPMVGMLIETVARLAGIPAVLTQDHAAFFAALDAQPPTHIVLDMTMPEMSGEQVLRALATRGCGARIVIASGVDAQQMQAAAEQARTEGLQIAGVLPKPFTPAALRALLA